jgi:hypothetical protein
MTDSTKREEAADKYVSGFYNKDETIWMRKTDFKAGYDAGVAEKNEVYSRELEALNIRYSHALDRAEKLAAALANYAGDKSCWDFGVRAEMALEEYGKGET